MATGRTATTILAGPSATAMIESAIAKVVRRSRGTYTSRADRSVSSFGTAIESTRCEAPNLAPWPPLVPSEWSPVETCETMTAAGLIHAPATFGTSVNKG